MSPRIRPAIVLDAPHADSRPAAGAPEASPGRQQTSGVSPLAPSVTALPLAIGPEAAELMARVRDGDTVAFEQIVDTFWRRTLAYVRHLCGDSDRAYDVTQEAFSRLWEKRADWTSSGSVRVWLLRTARNLVISDERKLKVRTQKALDVAREYPRVPTPLDNAEAAELRVAIHRALHQLSPRRKEVFTLFHLQGLSYREISGIMGVRPQTVANYLQAALADLRVLLSPHFPAEPLPSRDGVQGTPGAGE
jgi:RNA polymerase sigma factor (sigma-70 family)